MKPSTRIFLCIFFGSGLFILPNLSSFTVSAIESAEQDIQQLIQHYYESYNQLDLVSADQIVDHRLKHINENGVIQQFLVRDEVTNGTRRFQHQLKYHTDFYYHQVPSHIQIHPAKDISIATFSLLRERRQKDGDALLEGNHFRVTWVLQHKNGKWVVLHEQLSNHTDHE